MDKQEFISTHIKLPKVLWLRFAMLRAMNCEDKMTAIKKALSLYNKEVTEKHKDALTGDDGVDIL